VAAFALRGGVVRPSAGYEPRPPDDSALYQVVRDHIETFRAQAGHVCNGEGLPRFVEEEFDGVDTTAIESALGPGDAAELRGRCLGLPAVRRAVPAGRID
jgi:hypothetical protein